MLYKKNENEFANEAWCLTGMKFGFIVAIIVLFLLILYLRAAIAEWLSMLTTTRKTRVRILFQPTSKTIRNQFCYYGRISAFTENPPLKIHHPFTGHLGQSVGLTICYTIYTRD